MNRTYFDGETLRSALTRVPVKPHDAAETWLPIGDIVKQLIGDAATRKAVRFVVIDPPSRVLPPLEDELARTAVEGCVPFHRRNVGRA
jgi:hypothetical protein